MKEVRAGMGISEGVSWTSFRNFISEKAGTYWSGYKKKNGRSVPNCIPENSETTEIS
jgi:hypothetical protein